MYNIRVRNLYLVSLHPENKTYNRIHVVDLQTEIKELFAERMANLQNN